MVVFAELWALVTLVIQFIKPIQEKLELVKQVWELCQLFPAWIELCEKVNTLKRKLGTLIPREEDIIEELRLEELRTGHKRKREVETWLERVQQKKNYIQWIEQKAEEKKPLFRLLLGSIIERNIREVNELLEQGSFPNGLTHYTYRKNEPLLTNELVGHQRYLDTITEWLNDSSVLRVGVYGVKGVGKTAILTHMQNRLLQRPSTTFEHVYWVSVTEKTSVHKLQSDIAKEIGLNLSDEEVEMKRAAELHRAITKRGKCVIILDGVGKPFIEDVGIPREANGCKMLFSTESRRNWIRMVCDRHREIEPLPHDEAMTLFRQTLSLRDPSSLGQEIEEILESIVRVCQGLPSRLIDGAKELRGVTDVNDWRVALSEATKFAAY